MPSAAGRERMNQGETMALMAEALIAPQPSPLSAAAAKSCQGSPAAAHPQQPAARQMAPALVTVAEPKRRCREGRLAPAMAPTRKCTVTAAEISATGQPLVRCTTLRKMGGP